MQHPTVFRPADPMRSVIAADPSLLMVLARFGVSLGFADLTVEEVCVNHHIHTATFLTTVNFMSGRQWNDNDIDLRQFMTYLQNAHDYFLAFALPMIRRKLIEAIDCSSTDGLGFLILRFYDGYVTEVRKHMQAENERVFPYVERLLSGERTEGFNIDRFASHHTHIDPKLKELKDIIVRYYPGKGSDLLNSALFDIINCEHDLRLHCQAEDSLFVPAVKQLEMSTSISTGDGDIIDKTLPTQREAAKLTELSEREREIVCLVAKGLSNKEIADRLCLSVHTVTTHRRNITSKLQIHSTAGLTIFAIVNGLVSASDLGA